MAGALPAAAGRVISTDMVPKDKTLLLIDGSYYAYRSFFAIREMEWGGDISNNAVFGFAHDLRRMLERTKPDMACVLWDGGLPERRTSILPGYKQQRDAMPDDLKRQLPTIRDMTDAMGVRNVRVEGEEADDLVASYAKKGAEMGCDVVIGTNDKDIFQIASERIAIYSTAKKHLRENETWRLLRGVDVEEVWGVSPGKIVDVLALMGDSSDNIPGISGIGPKTAVKLVRAAGSLRSLMEEPGKYASERFSTLISNGKEALERNISLVSLKDDLDLPEPVERLRVAPRYGDLAVMARGLGFNSIVRMAEREGGDRALRMPSAGGGIAASPPKASQMDLF